MNIIIPMAGSGTRFSEVTDFPKPMIPISGKPMVVRSIENLPKAQKYIFVCLNEHLDNFPVREEISKEFPNGVFVGVDEVTPGLIFTAEIGINECVDNKEDIITISCCDNSRLYDIEEYYRLIGNKGIDAFVWGVKNDPTSFLKPAAYEWIDINEDLSVKRIGIKEPISDNPYEDYMVLGTYTFSRAQDYLDAMSILKEKMDPGNKSEFYGGHLINSMIERGKRVSVIPADLFISWGYPDQIRSYELWERYFRGIIDAQ